MRVHHNATGLIEKQMRINVEQKATAAGTPKAQIKGHYARIGLHPEEDTGFNLKSEQTSDWEYQIY